MDKINHIRNMEKYEHIYLREIAKTTGHHFDTVKRYIDKVDFNEKYEVTSIRPSLLDSLKVVIDG